MQSLNQSRHVEARPASYFHSHHLSQVHTSPNHSHESHIWRFEVLFLSYSPQAVFNIVIASQCVGILLTQNRFICRACSAYYRRWKLKSVRPSKERYTMWWIACRCSSRFTLIGTLTCGWYQCVVSLMDQIILNCQNKKKMEGPTIGIVVSYGQPVEFKMWHLARGWWWIDRKWGWVTTNEKGKVLKKPPPSAIRNNRIVERKWSMFFIQIMKTNGAGVRKIWYWQITQSCGNYEQS